MSIKETIRNIKLKRLTSFDKLLYLLGDTKIVTNDPPGSTIKFFVSSNNNVLFEVDDKNFLFRFNYDLIWIPYYEDIWSKHTTDKVKILLHIAKRTNINNTVISYRTIGGVSVKRLPYNKIGENERYV